MFRLRTGSGSSSGRACSSPRTRENRPPQAPKKSEQQGRPQQKELRTEWGNKSLLRPRREFVSNVRYSSTLAPTARSMCACASRGAAAAAALPGTSTAAATATPPCVHKDRGELLFPLLPPPNGRGRRRVPERPGGWMDSDPTSAIFCKLNPAAATPLPFRPSVGRELSLPMNPESPPPAGLMQRCKKCGKHREALIRSRMDDMRGRECCNTCCFPPPPVLECSVWKKEGEEGGTRHWAKEDRSFVTRPLVPPFLFFFLRSSPSSGARSLRVCTALSCKL